MVNYYFCRNNNAVFVDFYQNHTISHIMLLRNDCREALRRLLCSLFYSIYCFAIFLARTIAR